MKGHHKLYYTVHLYRKQIVIKCLCKLHAEILSKWYKMQGVSVYYMGESNPKKELAQRRRQEFWKTLVPFKRLKHVDSVQK